ncbi:MAG: hypothetical protein NUV76_12080, partial [Candidatus Kuenenia sp.]|nr:hypothetical protein [Candidatus Kuenenia sp.]
DAIVEFTETGSSLKANKLRIVETIMESSTLLIANHHARTSVLSNLSGYIYHSARQGIEGLL